MSTIQVALGCGLVLHLVLERKRKTDILDDHEKA
jgi:hypothetical protein